MLVNNNLGARPPFLGNIAVLPKDLRSSTFSFQDTGCSSRFVRTREGTPEMWGKRPSACPISISSEREINPPAADRGEHGRRWQRQDSPLTTRSNKTSKEAVRGMTCARVAPNVLSPRRLSGIPNVGQGEGRPWDGKNEPQNRIALEPMPNTLGFAVEDRDLCISGSHTH